VRGQRCGSLLRLFLHGCLAGTLLLAGCAHQAGLGTPPLPADEPRILLAETPFFPQSTHQCGPAALATLLVNAGKETSPAELAEEIYLPERRGSLQVELLGATRRAGLLPYPIAPSREALIAELRAGRPVLVLQNLGLRALPVWHYSVVIGYEPGRDRLILRSGKKPEKAIPTKRFIASWRRASSWGLVVLRPGELPAQPDPERYLEAVAALEAVGRYEAALAAYRAALTRWPNDARALLGVGNALYGLGDLQGAAHAYRRLVAEAPNNPVGYNNLAQVLAEQGHRAEAPRLLAQGLALATEELVLRDLLRQTQHELLRDEEYQSSRK